ncbi:AgmX/PglI C-terminal domain-containing protein [Stigmatella hybrida]|uniref:AgmX/PglI C-terminal domain-containing protein n=1 Tax=Stigmatella hybrida TaxID=394097 RepID=UPI001CDB11F1|nr:AgmX/PglI C-terminal domain-containing protein [Stigmatella hybrida]
MGRHQELELEPAVSADVHDALGEDLDAYLDRELLRPPAPEPKPASRAVTAPRKPRKSLQGMLALAAEEERWMGSKPGPEGQSESPPRVREAAASKKPPEVSETQTTQVLLPELAWGAEPAPLSEEETASLQKPWQTLEDTLRPPASRRRLTSVLLAVGVLGVGALGVGAACAFWAMRPAVLRAQEVKEASVPAGTVAAVAQAPAKPEPVPEPPRPKPPVRQTVASPEPAKTLPKAPVPTPVPTAVKAAPEPSKLDSAEDLDAEFAQKLSVADKRSAPAPGRKRAAPGWGPSKVEEEDLGDSSDGAHSSGLPERLEPSEIQRVVVANQPAIASCIRRHKEATGSEGGSFVLRWTILSSGSTAQVGMASEEMRGTPLARCIEGLVRGWKFPRHRVQQAPIQFPFRF